MYLLDKMYLKKGIFDLGLLYVLEYDLNILHSLDLMQLAGNLGEHEGPGTNSNGGY